MTLTFNKNSLCSTENFSVKPVLEIIKIIIKTSEKKWIEKFYNATLIIEFTAINDNNMELGSSKEYLPFSSIISSQQHGLTIDVRKTYRLPNELKTANSVKFTSKLLLENVLLSEDEEIILDYMDSEHIKKRVDDWENRIEDLIGEITNWNIADVKPLHKQIMNEEMMRQFDIPARELSSIGLYKSNSLKIALKPYGLWLFGANGRIDLLTSNGVYILIDDAKNFLPAKWKLVSQKNNSMTDFNRETLLAMLDK